MKEISSTGTWEEQRRKLNENFQNIAVSLQSLEGAAWKTRGYFKTSEELRQAYPTANVGDRAFITGNGYPYAIWLYDKERGWYDSGLTGGEEDDGLGDEELLSRILGTSDASSALTDPQIELGDFSSVEKLNNRLNSLTGSKYCGRLRASLNGQNIEVYQFAISHTDNLYTQICIGNVRPANDPDGGGSLLDLSAEEVNLLIRRSARNEERIWWMEWIKYPDIQEATPTSSGLMSAKDKKRLDEIPKPRELDQWKDYLNLKEATSQISGLMSANDKKLLEHILYIGEFSSKDAACNYAARSEIAGNKNAALLIFKATGTTGELLEGRIFQQVNGNKISMQYLMWDRCLYRRNVTGASGVEGGATNAFAWEETGAQKLAYDASSRKITMSSYENGKIAEAEFPVATDAKAGLMSSAMYGKLYGDVSYVQLSELDNLRSSNAGHTHGLTKPSIYKVYLTSPNIVVGTLIYTYAPVGENVYRDHQILISPFRNCTSSYHSDGSISIQSRVMTENGWGEWKEKSTDDNPIVEIDDDFMEHGLLLHFYYANGSETEVLIPFATRVKWSRKAATTSDAPGIIIELQDDGGEVVASGAAGSDMMATEAQSGFMSFAQVKLIKRLEERITELENRLNS